MHLEAKIFTLIVKSLFPQYFEKHLKVLDVGSGDINGNNRELFDSECDYTGIDVVKGPNVTFVSTCAEYYPEKGKDALFDTIVSTECFEHDIDFVRSLHNCIRLLKSQGLFFFSCASTGRKEHGTPRTTKQDSFTMQLPTEGTLWYPNYYRNLTAEDIQETIPIHIFFDKFSFEYGETNHDLYFWGIRNSTPFDINICKKKERKISEMSRIFNSKKDTLFHRSNLNYPKYLDEYRYKTGVKYLEIDFSSNDSLQYMRDYLVNAERIVGLEYKPKIVEFSNGLSLKTKEIVTVKTKTCDIDNHIFIESGCFSDSKVAYNLSQKHGRFQIILHNSQSEENISVFKAWFPLLSQGGLYIIEHKTEKSKETGNIFLKYLNENAIGIESISFEKSFIVCRK